MDKGCELFLGVLDASVPRCFFVFGTRHNSPDAHQSGFQPFYAGLPWNWTGVLPSQKRCLLRMVRSDIIPQRPEQNHVFVKTFETPRHRGNRGHRGRARTPYSGTSVPLYFFLFGTRHHLARGPQKPAFHAFYIDSSKVFSVSKAFSNIFKR